MQNYLSRSTVQDGREATTPTSSLFLNALLTCACANPVVVAHPTPFRRRFSLRKSDRDGYSTELDKPIEDVEPIPENYGGFVNKVREASRRYILQGSRTNHPSKQWGTKPLHLFNIVNPFSRQRMDILNGYAINTVANNHVALSSHRNSHLYITYFHVL